MTDHKKMVVQRITDKHEIIIQGNSNSSTLGYMILAAQALDIPRKDIKKLEREMQRQFDLKTIDEAEKAYQNF